MSSQITIRPVGRVRAEQGRYTLVINNSHKTALKELEGFSHIQVLYWAHGSDTPEKRGILTSKHPYKNSPDEMGIFATRSQVRPNPVLISAVSVIHIDHDTGCVELPWIDAENNSPIIDIKPYQPCFDRVRDAGLPGWCADWPQCHEESGTFDWDSVFTF